MGANMNIMQQIREYIAENVLLGDGDVLEEPEVQSIVQRSWVVTA